MTEPKYDTFGRPTDGSTKNWAASRPHGRGTYRFATAIEAEECASRLAAQFGEPVTVWQAVAEYERLTPPVVRKALRDEPKPATSTRNRSK